MTGRGDWREGWGFWRGSSIPEDGHLWDAASLTWRAPVFGADFALQPSGAATPSPDQVYPAHFYVEGDDPFDPDPVRVFDGASWMWWIYAGHNTSGSGSTAAPQRLGRVTGTDDDGCKSWQDAWTFTTT